jgi:threonine-phosphate decarboxylase
MNNFTHGGNLREAIDKYNISSDKIIDFSSNINPLGIPDSIKELINKEIDEIYHYPDPEYKLLKKELSKSLNVNIKNLLPGNGSNELIYLLVNTFAPKRALILVPAYSEYERASISVNSMCEFLNFMVDDRFDFNVDRILKKAYRGVDVIFICNPNNPTGFLVHGDEIKYLVRKCSKKNIFVIVDEAFMDFIEGDEKFTLAEFALKRKNVAVLRALTKFFAIPGLRLGCLVGHSGLVEKLLKRQPTWSVNNLAQLIGIELLKNRVFIKKSREYVLKEKDIFFKDLREIEWLKPFKPSANFILCRINDSRITSDKLRSYIAKNFGMLVRDCSNFRGLDNRFIRLAVKTGRENKKLLSCLKKYYIDLYKGK